MHAIESRNVPILKSILEMIRKLDQGQQFKLFQERGWSEQTALISMIKCHIPDDLLELMLEMIGNFPIKQQYELLRQEANEARTCIFYAAHTCCPKLGSLLKLMHRFTKKQKFQILRLSSDYGGTPLVGVFVDEKTDNMQKMLKIIETLDDSKIIQLLTPELKKGSRIVAGVMDQLTFVAPSQKERFYERKIALDECLTSAHRRRFRERCREIYKALTCLPIGISTLIAEMSSDTLEAVVLQHITSETMRQMEECRLGNNGDSKDAKMAPVDQAEKEQPRPKSPKQ